MSEFPTIFSADAIKSNYILDGTILIQKKQKACRGKLSHLYTVLAIVLSIDFNRQLAKSL
jgi:hypothetical protein